MVATGETANPGVEQNGHVLFLRQVETHASFRAFFPPGKLSRRHACGIGKALLAQMSAGDMEKFLTGAPLETFTEHTLTERGALMDDLDVTRRRGFAIDGGDHNLGMRCIAAPVFDIHGEAIAGASVSGPTVRGGTEQISALSEAVVSAAGAMSKAIGGEPIRRPS